jgi:hypothetical protein
MQFSCNDNDTMIDFAFNIKETGNLTVPKIRECTGGCLLSLSTDQQAFEVQQLDSESWLPV